jgi:glycolate oxidase FAD binding subunit
MTDLADLQNRVRGAVASQRPLCIVGGDSKRHLGREPQGIPIDIKSWSGVVDYQPSELVITVRAGTTIAELQEVLAAENQVLAGEPPEYGGNATVGGTLACNLSGPSRPWSGSIRDHVLGVRMINGKAQHLRFGGQVMKNVAGYDVSRLMAGAMGTLGIVTEVTLKVMPRPEATITMRRSVAAADALQSMNEICRSPLPVTGACWHDGEMRVRLAGLASVIGPAAQQIEDSRAEEDDGFWLRLREMELPFFVAPKDLWCISLRSTHEHFELDLEWLIDWRGARRWLAASWDRDALDARIRKAGGELWHLRGAESDADVFPERGAAYRNVLLRLKQALDPAGIFNPGRLYSWL